MVELKPPGLVNKPLPPRKYSRVKSAHEAAEDSNWVGTLRSCLSRTHLRIVLTLMLMILVANITHLNSSLAPPYAELILSPDGSMLTDEPDYSHVDWSQYAYSQYVTKRAYLCNSLMIFEALDRVGSLAERFLMYPHTWLIDEESSTAEGRLLVQARDEYKVALIPIEVQHYHGEPTWADSFTKLLAFNQTQYKRVISLDSDANVLKSMDELFFLPAAPVAIPRAYWLDQPFFSSQVIVIEPSKLEFDRILDAFRHRAIGDFDMEIINHLYSNDCITIPYRRYDLFTQEFREENHTRYLGSAKEPWDPDKVLKEASFLHFSDWPFPKPWLSGKEKNVLDHQPNCVTDRSSGNKDCRNRDLWNGFYSDFKERRKRICKLKLLH